jgi:hypothetical protein
MTLALFRLSLAALRELHGKTTMQLINQNELIGERMFSRYIETN